MPSRYARFWGLSPALARRIKREAAWADVIFLHFHYQFASVVGGFIARKCRKPYVVFTHGSLHQYGVSARSKSLKLNYLKVTERRNFRGALFTAYCSQEEMDASLRFGKCQVVANGIAPAAFEKMPPRGAFRTKYQLENKLVFLFLGRIDIGKGIDLLLPAFRKMLDALPADSTTPHLILAGGNERGYEETVRRTIDELQLKNYITLTGLIGGDDKLGALQDADIYVLPSRSEGLSISMLEAMYMGLPMVITDGMGLWRRVKKEDCGLVISMKSEEIAIKELTDAMLRLANDPQRAEMGARGHRLVQEHFTWDAITQDLVKQLQEKISR
jgi:glycosyltransferase involved in cell wall biosynthesis